MAQPAIKYYTEADYLALERESTERHTFYAGEIFAMAGASYEHNVIESNIRFALHGYLKEKPCKEFGSNLRLHVPGRAFYTYPDVMVICGEPEFLPDAFDTVTNPALLVEILSESTADYDKGLKFDLYRSIAGLKEYLLVDAQKVHVLHYTKNEDSSWTLHEYREKENSFLLPSIGMHLTVGECYTGVTFNEPAG